MTEREILKHDFSTIIRGMVELCESHVNCDYCPMNNNACNSLFKFPKHITDKDIEEVLND